MSTEIVIDTNVLISFLTDRNLVQQEIAAQLFAGAERGEVSLIVPHQVVSELVYVLEKLYDWPQSEISRIVTDLADSPSLRLTGDVDWHRLLSLWPDEIRTFGDAIVASVAATTPECAVATFDQAFQRRLRALEIALAFK